MKRRGLAVVKLGGSHALQPHLKEWLMALAGCGGKALVVPGGGPFADVVRAVQPVIGFDDRAAHHMALLAMEQFAVAIAAMDGRFVCAADIEAIHAALDRGWVPVWMPTRMVLADADLPQTWDLTSDSLAAWMTGRLRAERLVMVKHEVEEDAGAGVDPLFGDFLRRSAAACTFLGPLEAARLVEVVGAAAANSSLTESSARREG